MPNKMLIDATHSEETRVVVLRGNRVEEFDFESANRKQLRGNIYLAKVTRVEPSLQAAFVDYGGNRHGFLAFGEIHPDYYQIPVADRQALIDEEERAARAADAEADHRAGRRAQRERGAHRTEESVRSHRLESSDPAESQEPAADAHVPTDEALAPESSTVAGSPAAEVAAVVDQHADGSHEATPHHVTAAEDEVTASHEIPPGGDYTRPVAVQSPIQLGELTTSAAAESMPQSGRDVRGEDDHGHHEHAANDHHPEAQRLHDHPDEATHEASEIALGGLSEIEPAADGGNVVEISSNGGNGDEETVESVGGADAMEEMPERTTRPRRQYKIQEVIKRRQVMLVQVVKEERGSKGAALTTYLSLAGRYSVLMPNTARGGGISRKITDAQDRRRLKELAQELEVPEGMGVILRTAGAARTKMEIKRDFEYLLRLWETVRDLTLNSTAPTLVYEEGSLIKRSIRDLYNKDIDEILVAGEEGYREAKTFMRMLMPSHAQTVKPFRDTLPVFTRFGIENQLDAMFQPVVQLRSGGYIVLNQTEALVAIDVNSGRATREHHIEDTALKTNLEAAEEIARQLRLRDLAGLIVIDFIDMDEKRNNRTVERRIKDALKHDRARIQVGHISHFGLLEMSRQRIRSSVLESSTENCPHCGGTGHLRSVSSVSLQLLRALEETLLKGATHNIIVRTRNDIALYLLNQKRAHLRMLEERFQISITVNSDATMGAQVSYVIEKGELVHTVEQAKAIAASTPAAAAPAEDEDFDEDEPEEEESSEQADEADSEGVPSFVVDEHGVAASSAGEAGGHRTSSPDSSAQGDRNDRRRRRRRRGRRGDEHREPPEQHHEPESGVTTEQPVIGAAREDEINGHSEPAEQSGDAAAAQYPTLAPDHLPDEGREREQASDQGPGDDSSADADSRRRRRGRRGGRRNRRDREGQDVEAFQPESVSAAGPDALSQGLEAQQVPDPASAPALTTEPAPVQPAARQLPDMLTQVADEPDRVQRSEGPASPPVQAEATISEHPVHVSPAEPQPAPAEPKDTGSREPASHEPVLKEPASKEAALKEPALKEASLKEPTQPAPKEPAPSRRRSTVREPAPVAANGAVASESAVTVAAPGVPPPEPVVIVTSSSDTAEADRPRRAGWWSKRVLGKS